MKKKVENKNKIWNLTKKTLGVILIIIGIAGLVLPLIQGILLILIGAGFLGDKHIKRFLEKILRKFI